MSEPWAILYRQIGTRWYVLTAWASLKPTNADIMFDLNPRGGRIFVTGYDSLATALRAAHSRAEAEGMPKYGIRHDPSPAQPSLRQAIEAFIAEYAIGGPKGSFERATVICFFCHAGPTQTHRGSCPVTLLRQIIKDHSDD